MYFVKTVMVNSKDSRFPECVADTQVVCLMRRCDWATMGIGLQSRQSFIMTRKRRPRWIRLHP